MDLAATDGGGCGVSQAIPALSQRVLIKRALGLTAIEAAAVGDPTAGGFAYDWHLRCRGFSCVSGASVGSATFDFVPTDGQLPSFETVLNQYSTDDRVRVIVDPPDHPVIGIDLPEGQEGLTVFEGVFERVPFEVSAVGGIDDERVEFVAVPNPAMDNVAPEHRVRGRWVAKDPTAQVPALGVVETLDLPAVFNFRGRPNQSTLTVTSAELGTGTLAAPLYTHDDDPLGQRWTVRTALASVLVAWGVGVADAPLSRGFDVEEQTRQVLGGGEASGPAWLGIDDELPEVNVHGLGVLEAMEAVCDAAGYELNVQPHYGLDDRYDRLYVLSVQRRGGGPEAYLDLEPRGAFSSTDPNQILRRNTITRFRGVRDAGRVRNDIYAVGRTYIEAALELRPLWRPEDVTADTTAADYALRHVISGQDYLQYRHVGRLWGIDCVGVWSAAGYQGGRYAHPGGGFDWVAELGLAGSAIDAARGDAGVDDALVWSRRLRHLLPLRRPASQLLGLEYLVEVTEDAGETWVRVPLRVETLREHCGLMLDVQDLSKINLATIATPGLAPTPEASWWGLMFPAEGDPLFGVRVTCCVAADHAAAARAPREVESGSVYARRAIVRTELEEVWSVPGSLLNDGQDVVRIGGWGTDDLTRDASPLALAQRERDARKSMRLSAEAYSWQMDFYLHKLGDRVSMIRGRNYRLALDHAPGSSGGAGGDASGGTSGGASGGGRAPSIAGIHVDLSGSGEAADAAQAVRLALADNDQILRATTGGA